MIPMNRKNMTILMTLLGAVLFAVSVVVYLSKDREGPEISFSGDSLVYSQGDDTSVLLTGVTAEDKRDGDVSDTLKIDRVTSMETMNYVVVTYVARDRNNNISKAERWINLTDGSTASEPVGDLVGELEESSDVLPESMLSGTEEQTHKKSDESKDNKEQTEEETGEETDSQSQKEEQTGAAAGLESQLNNRTQTSDQGSTELDSELTEREGQEESKEPGDDLVSTGAPIIRITSHEVKLRVGERFDCMDYVKNCVDDVDTIDQLYSRIIVNGEDADGNYVGSGTIDTNRITTYRLKYYVIDTDGNMSNVEEMTVQIEG